MNSSTTLSLPLPLLLLLLSLCCLSTSSRVKNSPYPYSGGFGAANHMLFVYSDSAFTPTQVVALETLQGRLCREGRQEIYRTVENQELIRSFNLKLSTSLPSLNPNDVNGIDFYLQELIENYGIIANYTYQYGNFSALIAEYKDVIKGYYLFDTNSEDSINVAISLSAGMSPFAIAIDVSDQITMESLGISLLIDVRNKTEEWIVSSILYEANFSTSIAALQWANKSAYLADYSVFAGGVTTSTVYKSVLERLHPQSALVGWDGIEWNTVEAASINSVFVNAADWAADLSVFTNFDIDTFEQRTHTLTPKPPRQNVHTVCFLFTDGDNIQWLLNAFAQSENWYGSPLRGKTNIGWTLSPALSELAPTVMSFLYGNASNTNTGKDFFVAGASGVGYIYPDLYYENIQNYSKLTSEFMNKSDLGILNVIGDSPSKVYLEPLLEQSNIDAVFFYYFTDYSGMKGEMIWVGDKPIIGGRWNLWEGFETPASLAAKLNAMPTEIDFAQGYSLIPVHAWSMNVSAVLECVSMLNSNVQVVTPEVFVSLIRENVIHVDI